jgi:hypothetical protein
MSFAQEPMQIELPSLNLPTPPVEQREPDEWVQRFLDEGHLDAAECLVYVASPCRHPTKEGHLINLDYAREALKDAVVGRGEVAVAPHLLYTQILNDMNPAEAALGMRIGLRLLSQCDILAVYQDRGITDGMKREIELAQFFGINIQFRNIYN